MTCERGQQPVHVGLFTSFRHPGAALCIVAPDRPGLLAIISAALATSGLEVVEAEIYTRHATASLSEAVDLLWVCRQPPLTRVAITRADALRLASILVGLLARAEVPVRPRTSSFIRKPATSSTALRFIENGQGRFVSLEIEVNDRSGVLLAICQALFSEQLQIVGSRIASHHGRVHGRFDVVELDDRPVAPERRKVIQLAVLSAIDDLPRSTAAAMVE